MTAPATAPPTPPMAAPFAALLIFFLAGALAVFPEEDERVPLLLRAVDVLRAAVFGALLAAAIAGFVSPYISSSVNSFCAFHAWNCDKPTVSVENFIESW